MIWYDGQSLISLRSAEAAATDGDLARTFLHPCGLGLGGDRLGRVVGGVEPDEEVVGEQRRRPDQEPHEGCAVDGSQQEDVDEDGRRRQPWHERHPPHLGRARLGHAPLQVRRSGEPRGDRDHVRHPPTAAGARHPPARGGGRGRGDDHGEARHELVPVRGRGLAGDVVAADEQGHGDEREDEERGDGEQVGEDAEVGEERDDGGGDHHDDGGVHRCAEPRVHLRQARRHHVRPRDVGQVPGLPDGADEEHRGHALERAERHDVLGPVHADGRERDAEGRVGVDLGVGLHEAEHQRQEAVYGGGERHGADETHGDVPGGVLRLLRHGAHGVEADVREEEHGRGREDAARPERREVGGEVGGVGFRQPHHDDEGDDDEVQDGEHVVEARRALGAEHGQRADRRRHRHRDRVQLRVALRQRRRVHAEVVRVVVQQRREVGRPRPRHRRPADAVLEDDVARRDERHEIPQLHPEVREWPACYNFMQIHHGSKNSWNDL